jgi:hypothetical protein
MASVPVAHWGDDGQPYFVASDVGRAVDAFAASVSGRKSPPCDPAPKGKPGRRNTTADIAVEGESCCLQVPVHFYCWDDRAVGAKVEAWANTSREKLDQIIDKILAEAEIMQQLAR